MLLLSHIVIAAGLGLAAGAPSKSYHGSSHHKVKCRTEYTTVYETEHKDIETTECVTKWVPECKVTTEKKCRPITREVVSYDDFDRDQSSSTNFLF